MHVITLADRGRIREFLLTDRFFADYALGDLDPAHFQFTEWFGAEESGELRAVVMLYNDLEPPIFFATGEAHGIELILDRVVRLPRLSLSIREEHLPTIKKFYRTEPVPMWKMALLAEERNRVSPFMMEWKTKRRNPVSAAQAIENRASWAEADRRPAPTGEVASMQMDAQRERSARHVRRTAAVARQAGANLIRLRLEHMPLLEDLYSYGGGDAFRRRSLELGVFYGVFEGERLVSVAGTHIVSENERIAALGNVMTHPNYRGRGLATLATSAVCEELLKRGIELIGLSVIRSNEAAARVYEKIGFKRHVPFYEGTAVQKSAA